MQDTLGVVQPHLNGIRLWDKGEERGIREAEPRARAYVLGGQRIEACLQACHLAARNRGVHSLLDDACGALPVCCSERVAQRLVDQALLLEPCRGATVKVRYLGAARAGQKP